MLDLIERIEEYYQQTNEDAQAFRIEPLDFAQLGEGVYCVRDNLGDYDIFFDSSLWEVRSEVKGKYSRTLDAVHGCFDPSDSLISLPEEAWNPSHFRKRRRTSFTTSLNAAKAYLEPGPGAELYDAPKIVH